MKERVKISESEEEDNQSNGGEKKLYPDRQRCKACKNLLTQSNPLDTCYRCQNLGVKGEPRKPILSKG